MSKLNLLLGCLLVCVCTFLFSAGRGSPIRAQVEQAVTAKLSARNSEGRSGAYFLPQGYRDRATPLILAFHGTDSSGRAILNEIAPWAARAGAVVVAPDSRRAPAGYFAFEVGDEPRIQTPDYTHALACVNEVERMPYVRIDWARSLVLGHSGGASMAPYIATNATRFAAFAVLHGGVFQGGFGRRRVRGWFSTGASDPMRPPQALKEAIENARSVGVRDVVYREFPGGHGLSALELDGLFAWFLGPSANNTR